MVQIFQNITIVISYGITKGTLGKRDLAVAHNAYSSLTVMHRWKFADHK